MSQERHTADLLKGQEFKTARGCASSECLMGSCPELQSDGQLGECPSL